MCSKPDLLRCIRENLTAIRNDVNPKYADDLDNPQKVQNIINYCVEKYSTNHGPGSSLNEDAKKSIATLVRRMSVKEKEPAIGNTSQTAVLQPNKETCDEKVKVKIDLRSKISELELVEEAGKLKISSCIEEENARSSALERKIKDALEKKNHLRAKVEDITSAIERLLEDKRCIEKEQEEVEKNVEEMNKKLEESKEASTLAIKHQTEELENVQEKIRNVRKELDLAEGRPQANNDLEKFMMRQIEELEEELVCPVCLEVTTKAPIYKCSDDHLICGYCSTLVCLPVLLCFHPMLCISIPTPGSADQI